MLKKRAAVAAAAALLLGWAAAADTAACLAPAVSLRSCMAEIDRNPAACCGLFEELVKDISDCLCDVLQGEAAGWAAIVIDVARAVSVLVNCSVDIPPVSNCSNLTWMPPGNTVASTNPAQAPSSAEYPRTLPSSSPVDAPAQPPSPSPVDAPAQPPSPAKAPTTSAIDASPAPSIAPSVTSGAMTTRSPNEFTLFLSLAASVILTISGVATSAI